MPYKKKEADDESSDSDEEMDDESVIGVTLTKATHLLLAKLFTNVVIGVKHQIGYESGESEESDDEAEVYEENEESS